MSQLAVADLVSRCASTTNQRERSDLTNEISEALYGEPLELRILSPLFERESFGNWQSLTMILEEHSYRSDEVADWLGELVQSPAEEVRFRALLCIMELDPRTHPHLVARMLEALGDNGLDAGRIAVAQYLAHVDLDRLRASLPFVSSALAPALHRFVESRGVWVQEDQELPPGGSVDELLAVASAARRSNSGSRGTLAELARRTGGPARVAAETLLRQQWTKEPEGGSSDG